VADEFGKEGSVGVGFAEDSVVGVVVVDEGEWLGVRLIVGVTLGVAMGAGVAASSATSAALSSRP
jgi:hypothetical protein